MKKTFNQLYLSILNPLVLLKVIEKYGFLDFAKICAEQIAGKISGGAINRYFYRSALESKNVYFGEHLSARQGVLRRHFFMTQLMANHFAQKKPEKFRVLEIGSYAGASAITWALAIQKSQVKDWQVVCVDPWETDTAHYDESKSDQPEVIEQLSHALKSGQVFTLFNHNTGVAGVRDFLQIEKGTFKKISEKGGLGQFDLIYIDGDHRYHAVLDDLQRSAPLVKPEGILCGDDLDKQWSEIDQVNCSHKLQFDVIVDPKTFYYYHPGVTKAVWDFFGTSVSCWNGFWAMKKSTDGKWNQIQMDNKFKLSGLPPHLHWWKTKLSMFYRKS